VEEKKVTAERARQGRNGYRVFTILAVGLALAGAVWLGLEFWGESIDSRSVDQSGVSADQPQSGSAQ
jgi:hypothetical protein